jgi:hypothetical protein
MPFFEVWTEGYVATGEHGTAKFWGSWWAEDLRGAADQVFSDDPDLGRHYNRERLQVWACRIFDNEADARKSYG